MSVSFTCFLQILSPDFRTAGFRHPLQCSASASSLGLRLLLIRALLCWLPLPVASSEGSKKDAHTQSAEELVTLLSESRVNHRRCSTSQYNLMMRSDFHDSFWTPSIIFPCLDRHHTGWSGFSSPDKCFFSLFLTQFQNPIPLPLSPNNDDTDDFFNACFKLCTSHNVLVFSILSSSSFHICPLRSVYISWLRPVSSSKGFGGHGLATLFSRLHHAMKCWYHLIMDLDTLLLRWFGRIQSCTDSRAALQDGTILISLRSALHPDLPEKERVTVPECRELNGSSLFLIHSSCLLMILQRWIWWTYPVTICPRMIRAESFTSGYVIRSYTEGSVSQPLQSRWSM